MAHNGQLEVHVAGEQLPIAYSDVPGDPQLTPLFYVPGWGCTKEDIAGAREDPNLADRRIVAIDNPGCGDSPPLPSDVGPLDSSNMTSIVRRVARRLEVGPAVYAGHSGGGAVIAEMTRFTDETAGVVSVMGNMALTDCFMTNQVAMTRIEYFTASGFAAFVDERRGSKNPGMRRYADMLAGFDELQIRTYHGHAVELVNHCRRGQLLQRFIDYDGPKLFVHGASEEAEYLGRLIELGIPVATIKDADHFPFVDQPAAYFKVLGDFMVQVDEARN